MTPTRLLTAVAATTLLVAPLAAAPDDSKPSVPEAERVARLAGLRRLWGVVKFGRLTPASAFPRHRLALLGPHARRRAAPAAGLRRRAVFRAIAAFTSFRTSAAGSGWPVGKRTVPLPTS